MRARGRWPWVRGIRSESRCTSARTRTLRAQWRSWSRRFDAPSSTRSATTSGWTRTTYLISALVQRPEGPVPEDQRIAGADGGCLNLSDADVVISCGVDLAQAAFEPSGAPIYEWDAIAADAVRERAPFRVH